MNPSYRNFTDKKTPLKTALSVPLKTKKGKQIKKLLLLLAIIIISLSTSCNKEPVEEPVNYHNLVRFNLNGEEWKTYNYLTEGFLPSVSRSWDLQFYRDFNKSIEMTAGLNLEDGSIKQAIHIATWFDTLGDHNLIFLRREFQDWLNNPGCKLYDLDTNAVHRMTILEVDTVEQIMIGTFEFDAINECGDTVFITDGYFDLIYRP